MKRIVVVLFIVSSLFAWSQDEQQLESLVDVEETEIEDDSYLQQLAAFRKDPINLNTAEWDELTELRMLTDLQIESLISYRWLLGPIIDIYELQAIPAWSIPLIRRLLPFVTITNAVPVAKEIAKRLKEGEHIVLLRVSQVIEKINDTKYNGSPYQLFFRYRYNYKNLLQYGVTGDKDAGEQFFKGAQSKGFDFYSFHVFIRKKGIIQSLALGDFAVNMGQGLIHWQGLAFKKSAEVTGIKRQSPVLRPYNSAGEYNFHRGAGITIQKGRLEGTVFISFRALDASIDTIDSKFYFTSFQSSGYHRTDKEISNKNGLRQSTAGMRLHYKANEWQISMNSVYYKYSASMQRQKKLYDLFAATGDHWLNAGIDYSFTHRNIHFFGEAAIDQHFHRAMLNAVLISVDPKVDLSLLHRVISKEYQSIRGNAFTENSFPSNENGIYAGIAIRLSAGWRIEAYADMYRFPWLKYQVDMPSAGKDLFVQLTWTLSKQAELYTRFKTESGKHNWRIHFNHKLNASVTLRKRIEMIWLSKGEGKQAGFLSYVDMLYKPLLNPFAAIVRLQYFETDGYDTRLYAYENDVLYSYSIPVFYGKGYRYSLTLQYDYSKRISFWLRLAQTVNENDRIELKLQTRIVF